MLVPFLAVAASAVFLPAQTAVRVADSTTIRIDASQPARQPTPVAYDAGSATTPDGETLGLTNLYLTRNGKPWLPTMGEFHFSRYPRAQWEEELLKMKAAGVQIVATYVIWIHHEEVGGIYDWAGDRNLRAFAMLCAKHNLLLVVRIGPWDHAEVRNGGLPDWVLQQGPTRINDPAYLVSVAAWFSQIGQQLKGLLWKDGGPVIGIQLENEYAKRGPGAGEEHLLALKKLALASGFDVPYTFLTGWDRAILPSRVALPLYGGYPAAPWDRSITKLPPQEVYAFRFRSRVSADPKIAAQTEGMEVHAPEHSPVPWLTAELGGGNEVTYHRRPVFVPDDIAALFPVQLGSGVNLYGLYMFQGGENPDGKLSTLQESQETGYPNDLPIKSYDFQAPLGEFGQEQNAFRKTKVFEYFLRDFGSVLAPMITHAPDAVPASLDDLQTPRASVRSRGQSGFIFFNNYVRGYTMPARPAMQFVLQLPNGKTPLLVPRHPVGIPSGAYFIWPFNLSLGAVHLRYATAQLFTRLDAAGGDPEVVYFEAIPGIEPEFSFDAASVRSVHVTSGKTERADGVIDLTGIEPGTQSSIDLVATSGERLRMVVLTAHEAENAWRIRLQGRERLLFTEQDFFADANRIWLRSRDTAHFAFSITPAPSAPLQANLPLKPAASSNRLAAFTAEAQPREVRLEWKQTRPAGLAPPVKLGPVTEANPQPVAQAPEAGPLQQAALWSLTVPASALDGLNDLFVEFRYCGDLARLSSGTRLLSDNFYNGQTWTVGLKRFLDSQGQGRFELALLPLRRDMPVYLEGASLAGGAPCHSGHDAQDLSLEYIRAVPEYQMEITAEGAAESKSSVRKK